MKNVLVAVVCTLGAVACGESRPAEDPSTRNTEITTEVTSTSARANRTPTTANGAPGANSANGSTANAARANATTGVPADGRDPAAATASGSGVQMYGSVDGNGNGNVAGTTNANGSGNAPSANNPGVANNTKDADNTKINDRDRHGAVTPMDQGGGKDRDITAAIRRAVVSDGALSFSAKNVKIITVGGKVTLRGPVKSDAEKTAIEAKAKATAGVAEVDNQLEVKK